MSRFRPRVSLLTAFLLTTIVGLSLAVVLLWYEVEPLRQEVRRLRTEFGYLSIDDPTKAYGIAVPTSEENTWRWRVYLPPGNKYTLYERSGHLPNAWSDRGIAWIESVKSNSVGTSSSGDSWIGELTLDVKFHENEGKWLSQTTIRKRDASSSSTGASTTSVYQPSGDWLSERRGRQSSSSLNDRMQKEFESHQPILLLHLQRQVIQELPNNGYTATSPQGDADGVMIWLEPTDAATNSPAAAAPP